MSDGQTTDRLITKRLSYGMALINIQRIRRIQSFTCSTHVEKAKWCPFSWRLVHLFIMVSGQIVHSESPCSCNYFHHIKALLTPCVHWWVFKIFKLCCDFLQNLIILVNVFYLYYLCSVLSGKLSVKLYHNSYVCQRSSWTNWIITDNPRFLFGSSTAAYKSQNRFVCHVDIMYISFFINVKFPV